jgi:tripartite-type tricarboxylate transporter receptor subunit TctC
MKKILLALLLVVASLSCIASECNYPCKPVTFVLGVVAGGPADALFVRPFSEFFLKETGQPMIVEYMPAGEGVVQIRHLKNSKPDGYTIGLVRSATAVYKPVMDTVEYDPLKDWTNIAFFVRYPDAIYVNAKNSATSLRELIANAPAKGLNVGMSFHGARILTYMMSEKANIVMEPIMYPGDAGANTALLGQHIDVVIGTIGGTPINLHRNGTFRMIATTGDRRVPSLPDVPTIRELGYDIEQYTFLAVGGPPNLDPVALRRINELVNKFMRDNEMQSRMNQDGMFTPKDNSPEAMSRFIESDIKFWDGFRRKHNIPKVDK